METEMDGSFGVQQKTVHYFGIIEEDRYSWEQDIDGW
jgi:hypothetical protein